MLAGLALSSCFYGHPVVGIFPGEDDEEMDLSPLSLLALASGGVVVASGVADPGTGSGNTLIGTTGRVRSFQKISPVSGGLTSTIDNVDLLGAVASLGDVDGDGVSDLGVCARNDDDAGFNAGACYVLFLNTDGTVKAEQKITTATGGMAIVLDGDDQFGRSVSGLGDVDGDGVRDLVVGAIGDDDAGSFSGAAYVFFLNANGTVKAEQKITTATGGMVTVLDGDDRLAISVAGQADIDGDGVLDLVCGAERDDDAASNAGALYVLFLNTNGTVKAEQKITQGTGGFTASLGANHFFSTAAALSADIDGDGVADLIVGAPGDDEAGFDAGAVYVLFLNSNGTVKAEQKITGGTGGMTGVLDASDAFGSAVAAPGDLDADGVPDIVVGSPADEDGGSARGAVYVLFLNRNGTVKAEQKISDTEGNFTATLMAGDEFGGFVTSPGDLDGDLVPDLTIGAIFDDDGGSNQGAVYVLFLEAAN